MKQLPGHKLILLSAVLITAVMSAPRLLLIQRDGLLARMLPFNLYAWILQVIVVFVFCLCIFYYNKNYLDYYTVKWKFFTNSRLMLANLLILIAFTAVGGVSSQLFTRSKLFLLNGYLIRLSITLILIFIELKILATVFYARQKEKENDKLRLANMSMELELLKAQLNPHFFFNALSSLSGVVREDPQQAQEYISHLSKIFRYSLNKPMQSLVSLKEELDEVISFCELMKMRHEQGFILSLDIDSRYHSLQLPHMSLQPLVENALKHNIATPDNPLTVSISAGAHSVEVRNNLQPKLFSMPGIGIGLANLNERFKILVQKEIEISNGNGYFTVKLPF